MKTNEDSSSEDDYMSDKVLQQAEQVSRVGLPLKRAQQREIEMLKRKTQLKLVNQTKKRHVIEEEQREQGLSKPIDASNKGFALLSAMGFKPGMTLGMNKRPKPDKQTPKVSTTAPSSSHERLAEPLPVTLKRDGRGGLGLAADKEEKAKERLKAHFGEGLTRRGDPQVLTAEFRKQRRSHFELRNIREDLAKSRRVCRQLDLEEGLTEAENKLFWPPVEVPDEATEDNATSDEVDEDHEVPDDEVILNDLTEHLRKKYSYCIWCGCRFRDADDLAECPGNTREAHDDE